MIVAMASVVTGTGYYLLVTNKAMAQDSDGHRPLLVQRLIEKFNLNPSEVDQVVSEVRGEMQSQHKLRHEERLNALVLEGKITEEQKSQILLKLEEWKSTKSEWKNLSREEMKTKMDERRVEMEDFFRSIGVDPKDMPMLMHTKIKNGYDGKRMMKGDFRNSLQQN